jgi:hypothetical protein
MQDFSKDGLLSRDGEFIAGRHGPKLERLMAADADQSYYKKLESADPDRALEIRCQYAEARGWALLRMFNGNLYAETAKNQKLTKAQLEWLEMAGIQDEMTVYHDPVDWRSSKSGELIVLYSPPKTESAASVIVKKLLS